MNERLLTIAIKSTKRKREEMASHHDKGEPSLLKSQIEKRNRR